MSERLVDDPFDTLSELKLLSEPRLRSIEHKARQEFLAHSARAVPAHEVPAYLQRRPTPRSGYGRDPSPEERAAINFYHRARHATRGMEAITPGASRPVADLALLCVTDRRVVVHNKYARTNQVYNKVVWEQGAFFTAPKALWSTSLEMEEKLVLAYLYARVDPLVFHRDVQFVVHDCTESEIAAHMSGRKRQVSVSKVCRILARLEGLGWLHKQQRGSNRPNFYRLAKYENGAWTYPAGSAMSSRKRAIARACRAGEVIDWDEVREPLVVDVNRFRRTKRRKMRNEAYWNQKEADAAVRAARRAARAAAVLVMPSGDGARGTPNLVASAGPASSGGPGPSAAPNAAAGSASPARAVGDVLAGMGLAFGKPWGSGEAPDGPDPGCSGCG